MSLEQFKAHKKRKHKHKSHKHGESSSFLVGQVSLKVPEDGFYRVFLGSRAWLGVTTEGNLIKPHRFGKVSESEGITKLVEFEWKANKEYVLEFYKKMYRDSHQMLSVMVAKRVNSVDGK